MLISLLSVLTFNILKTMLQCIVRINTIHVLQCCIRSYSLVGGTSTKRCCKYAKKTPMKRRMTKTKTSSSRRHINDTISNCTNLKCYYSVALKKICFVFT